MNVEDLVFDLPEELIASYPTEERDQSRLFVLLADERQPFIHRQFRDVGEYLREGDVLVFNNSRVLPARLFARRSSGALIEILLLNPESAEGFDSTTWRAMVRPGKKARTGEELLIDEGSFRAKITAEHDNGERTIQFETGGESFRKLLQYYGQMPLPPYILKRRQDTSAFPDREHLHTDADRIRYQTVYAKDEGSVAAPTAGLHFTPELLDDLKSKGIDEQFVTLHVGAGTFKGMEPGTSVEDHVMHFEEFEISEETAAAITRAKAEGRRVIAVGTTSVRTLESAWDRNAKKLIPGRGSTNMMIKPGYDWGVVDALITNFHLPRSTLLLLVCALGGYDRLLSAYKEAVAQEYRFFSYGDAMLILP